MSGFATHPNIPNKERNNGEGQKRKVYYAAPACHKELQGNHFSPFLN
jgi:hypothetical protein